jgi:phosphotransferase system enzyme I (PtsI)
MTTTIESETKLRGVPVSPGIEMGTIFLLQEEGFHFPTHHIDSSLIDSELQRLERAWELTVQQIEEIRNAQHGQERQLTDEIIDIHLMLASDIPLHINNRIEQLVREDHCHIETAFHRALQELLDRLSKSPLQRSEDVADIGQHVLRNLVGRDLTQFDNMTSPVVVVAEDLSPSMTVRLPKDKVLAFVTAHGSRTSHTAIMARALEIPAVVGVPDLLDHVNDEDMIIVDGDRGTVVIQPTLQTLERYKKLQEEVHFRLACHLQFRDLAAETKDGFTINLVGNIEIPEDVESVLNYGAKGVGLYRTEFLYMNRKDLPSEEEQFYAYRSVVEALAPETVVLRTLDIGGDKFPSSIKLPKEVNPFMGWRAIRFSLEQPEIFHTQLRAIMRASAYGNLSIMFPMISEVREMRLATIALKKVQEDLRSEGYPFNEDIPIGAMIEVPSSALAMEGLVSLVDFFSIGTNDLIQYTLAADRGNERTANLYDPLHPGVLHLIKNVVDKAHAHQRTVAVCGEMAGSIEYTLILIGLMVDELSMSPIAIPEVKRFIRELNFEEAVEIANQALKLTEPEEIRDLLMQESCRFAPWMAELMDSRSSRE